jgi:hypothetical protein
MDKHTERVMEEIRAAGVTGFGMKKFGIRHIPTIIHKDEHVKGVVYGRYREQNGPAYSEGILIATDRRIIFLDHKPGFTKSDEITYDIVSGVKITKAVFSAVTLHTRLGDFSLRFANAKCVRNFVRYVEERRLETDSLSEAGNK